MSFELLSRSYAGVLPHPRVEVYDHPAENLVFVGTPWGTSDGLKTACNRLYEYVSMARQDVEATSPFPRLPSLSPQGNNLRIGALLANEAVYQKENVTELRSACELLALHYGKRELTWIQAGAPHVLIWRNKRIHPLSIADDLGLEFSGFPHLPAHLLGIEDQIDLSVKAFRWQPGDVLILLSRTEVPCVLLERADQIKIAAESADSERLAHLTDAIVSENDQMPFWIGIASL